MAKAMDNPGESKPDKKNVPDHLRQTTQTPRTNENLRAQATNLQNQRGAQRASFAPSAPSQAQSTQRQAATASASRLSPEAGKAVKQGGPIRRDVDTRNFPSVSNKSSSPQAAQTRGTNLPRVQLVDGQKINRPQEHRVSAQDNTKIQQYKAKLQEKSGRGPEPPSKGPTPSPQSPRK
jgi:hypothetical protein